MSNREPPGPYQTPTWEGPGSPDGGRPLVIPPRWQLMRRLGSGGQAEVWLAWDVQVSENCAVKIFKPGMDGVARERIRREVWLGRKLQHPRIVRVHELIELPDRLAVAMEWVPGGTLSSKLAREPVSIEEAVTVADQVLDALEYLHGEKVLHRDIKPSNLLLDEHGAVKVADFGLARPLSPGVAVTVTADQIGTPGYMSPEQLRGNPPGRASDLYALGVTLYQCLSGKVPFEGTSAWEAARRQMQERAPSIRGKRKDCPKWLEGFIARLLEKEPEDRFPSAAAAREALKWRKAVHSPARRRRVLAWGTAALVMAALVSAGSWRLLRPPEAVRYQAEGKTVKGLAKDGSVLWTRTFPETVQQCETADIDGDGRVEGLVAAFKKGEVAQPDLETSSVAVLNPTGEILTQVQAEDVFRYWPFDFAKSLVPDFALRDLNGDSLSEVLVRVTHRPMYPSGIMIYWPDGNYWEPLLLHSGHILDVAPSASDRPWSLLFVAINNSLGHSLVAGELQLARSAASATSGGGQATIVKGPWIIAGDNRNSVSNAPLNWYTILGELPDKLSSVSIERQLGRATLRLGLDVSPYELDANGNPTEGANAGRDIRLQRLEFLSQMTALKEGRRVNGAQGAKVRWAEVERSCADVLREPAYKAIGSLVLARMLARVGSLDEAVGVLAKVAHEYDYQDIQFRLGHLLAIKGELNASAAVLEELLLRREGGRAQLDAGLLLIGIYTEARDEAKVLPIALNGFFPATMPSTSAVTQAALVRPHLYWDRPTEADCSAASHALVPDAGALSVLARWRLGRLKNDVFQLLDSLEKSFPEAEFENKTARAAVMLTAGREADCVLEMERWLPHLENLSREDFLMKQTFDLARALYVKALFATERHRGLEEAKRIHPLLRDGLLPGKLVDEVLQAGNVQ